MKPLRIALPKGRLLEPALQTFAAAGLEIPSADDLGSRRLTFACNEVEWVLVKDSDVPVYVQFGVAQLGLAGLDQILEHEADVYEPVTFDFGRCRLMLIAAEGAPPLEEARGLRLATKYPNIARRFVQREKLQLDVITLHGSLELAPVLSLAPYIIDVVDTGETVRAHKLRLLREIASISPCLIVNKAAYQFDARRVRRVLEAVS